MATLVCENYIFREISVLSFAKLQVSGISLAWVYCSALANGQNAFEKFVKCVLILQSLNNLSNLKSLSKCVPHLKFEQMLIRFTSFEELSMKPTEKVEKN